MLFVIDRVVAKVAPEADDVREEFESVSQRVVLFGLYFDEFLLTLTVLLAPWIPATLKATPFWLS